VDHPTHLQGQSYSSLPSRMIAKKPLLTDRMKLQRLEFAQRQHKNYGVEEWKKGTFLVESHFELRFCSKSWRCRGLGWDQTSMRSSLP
jgi:hypothetical protein